MVYFFIVLVGLILIAVWFGCIKVLQVDIVIDFKDLSSPFYNVGISFVRVNGWEENIVQDELMFGFYFVDVTLVFYKKL